MAGCIFPTEINQMHARRPEVISYLGYDLLTTSGHHRLASTCTVWSRGEARRQHTAAPQLLKQADPTPSDADLLDDHFGTHRNIHTTMPNALSRSLKLPIFIYRIQSAEVIRRLDISPSKSVNCPHPNALICGGADRTD